MFSSRRRPAFRLQDPSLVKTNLLIVAHRNDTYHPFGSQASGGHGPSPLGFASRPYGRFAFIEDEEATGLCDAGVPPVGQVHQGDSAEKPLRRGCLTAVPVPPDASASGFYLQLRSDSSFVKLVEVKTRPLLRRRFEFEGFFACSTNTGVIAGKIGLFLPRPAPAYDMFLSRRGF